MKNHSLANSKLLVSFSCLVQLLGKPKSYKNNVNDRLGQDMITPHALD